MSILLPYNQIKILTCATLDATPLATAGADTADADSEWVVLRPKFVNILNIDVPMGELIAAAVKVAVVRRVRPDLRNLLSPMGLTMLLNPDPLAFVEREERDRLTDEEGNEQKGGGAVPQPLEVQTPTSLYFANTFIEKLKDQHSQIECQVLGTIITKVFLGQCLK